MRFQLTEPATGPRKSPIITTPSNPYKRECSADNKGGFMKPAGFQFPLPTPSSRHPSPPVTLFHPVPPQPRVMLLKTDAADLNIYLDEFLESL